jgi:hypothetical protein
MCIVCKRKVDLEWRCLFGLVPDKPSDCEETKITCENGSMTEFPGDINFTSLARLEISNCKKLKGVKIVNNDTIEEIFIRDCPNLANIAIVGCKKLRHIFIYNCGLQNFFHSGNSNLLGLTLIELKKLIHISDWNYLEKLGVLALKHCPKLTEVPELPKNIINIELIKLPLEKPLLINSKFLDCMNISDCILPDFSSCINLGSIRIYNIDTLVSFPDISNLQTLWNIKISCCKNLTRLPELSSLKQLRNFSCYNCPKVTFIPDLSLCKDLNYFDCSKCEKLTCIPDLRKCESLEEVYFTGCLNLVRFPRLPKANLKRIEYSSSIEKLKEKFKTKLKKE